MQEKTYGLEIKELGAKEEGAFRGYLSVFDIVDEGGDLVERGAFAKTLRKRDVFPLLWGHCSQDPNFLVGTFRALEDDRGLLINAKFFRELEGGQDAYKVVKEFWERGVKFGLSIGYKAVDFKFDKINGQTIRRIKEIQLYEGSLTLFPINQEAFIQDLKGEAMDDPLKATIREYKTLIVQFSTRLDEIRREGNFSIADELEYLKARYAVLMETMNLTRLMAALKGDESTVNDEGGQE